MRKGCIVFLVLLLAPVGICFVSTGAAESTDNLVVERMGASQKYQLNPPEYQMDDRLDPFLPFISSKPDGSVGPGPDTPIVRPFLPDTIPFEPGQLQLVSIMTTPVGMRAMVQDATGKGYILSKDSLVGMYGKVARIEKGLVMIIETVPTKRGGIRTKEIIMRLKKEGEK